MPSRSKSSSRLATITWRSIALRTLPSWSRIRAASSNSSCAAASFMRYFESLQHRVVLAVEEVDQLRDELVVLLVVDRVDARRRALLDVRVQARPAESVVPVELGLRARPDRERAQQQVERLADGVRVRVRTEVADALALLAAQHHRARPLLVERDREVRVRLVVLQADVEAGPVLLDEVELEEERLDLVARPRSTRRVRPPAPSAACVPAAGTAGGSSSTADCAGSSPSRRRSPDLRRRRTDTSRARRGCCRSRGGRPCLHCRGPGWEDRSRGRRHRQEGRDRGRGEPRGSAAWSTPRVTACTTATSSPSAC